MPTVARPIAAAVVLVTILIAALVVITDRSADASGGTCPPELAGIETQVRGMLNAPNVHIEIAGGPFVGARWSSARNSSDEMVIRDCVLVIHRNYRNHLSQGEFGYKAAAAIPISHITAISYQQSNNAEGALIYHHR